MGLRNKKIKFNWDVKHESDVVHIKWDNRSLTLKEMAKEWGKADKKPPFKKRLMVKNHGKSIEELYDIFEQEMNNPKHPNKV